MPARGRCAAPSRTRSSSPEATGWAASSERHRFWKRSSLIEPGVPGGGGQADEGNECRSDGRGLDHRAPPNEKRQPMWAGARRRSKRLLCRTILRRQFIHIPLNQSSATAQASRLAVSASGASKVLVPVPLPIVKAKRPSQADGLSFDLRSSMVIPGRGPGVVKVLESRSVHCGALLMTVRYRPDHPGADYKAIVIGDCHSRRPMVPDDLGPADVRKLSIVELLRSGCRTVQGGG